MNNAIFDIDGTLVRSVDFDSRLYIRAVRDVFGDLEMRPDWSEYTHVTDTGILMQVLGENGLQANESRVQAVRSRFVELVDGHLAVHGCAPVEGAPEMLEALARGSQWRVGLATGGWAATAIAKLRSAGFSPESYAMASSDDHHERTEIMRLCAQRWPGRAGRTVYVGDGPWDQKAAAELGWGFVAVGPRLESAHPHWIRDFSDPAWPEVSRAALESAAGIEPDDRR